MNASRAVFLHENGKNVVCVHVKTTYTRREILKQLSVEKVSGFRQRPDPECILTTSLKKRDNGTVVSPMYDGKVPHWHHFSCFWQRAAPQSTADIVGYADLRWDDQGKVKKAIESGGAVGKSCEQKIEKDQICVSKKSVDPEKPQLGLIDCWYHTACFVSRREELAFKPEYSAAQLKGFNTLRAEDKEELKKRLPAMKSEGKRKSDEVDGVSKKQKKEDDDENKRLEEQLRNQSQQIWGIKDKLRKYCSINDMKELLIANGQVVPSGETNVVDCLADCMAFGALEACQECKGQLLPVPGECIQCPVQATARGSTFRQTSDWYEINICGLQSPMYEGKVRHRHHYSCIWQRAAPQSTAVIAGYTDLRWDNQGKVKKAIESGGAVGSDCVSKKSVDPEKPQLGLIDCWYHTACFVSPREELAFKPEYTAAQLKGYNTLRAEDKEELKKRLPAMKSEG
ncbi:poly [ADP-ribose] polymerase 1 [Solea senegalensis]|uniref:NAD(+) ADP-ribosyltransferase n=1 Tax=Solea senegalensis TaxID=28829 RepID=A0AAV6RTY8_SOLSE|nr:poly [ADP-ribose] polymerase 1 [Solea senegalensis]